MMLKMEILNSSGVGTGDYFYVDSNVIVRVTDSVVNSVPCVEIVTPVGGTGLKFAAIASDIVDACGPANFISLTTPDPKTTHVRASSVLYFYPSSGNTALTLEYSTTTVTESPDDILDALNAVTALP